MKLDSARLAERHGNIRSESVIVEKEFFNRPAFITKAQDEIIQAIARIHFHDVPEHRPVADPHHRLGDVISDIADAGSLTAAQNDRLHSSSNSWARLIFNGAEVIRDRAEKFKRKF